MLEKFIKKIVEIFEKLLEAFAPPEPSPKVEEKPKEEEKLPELPDLIYKRLEGCYPPHKERVILFIKRAHARGMMIYVVMSIRTIKEQDALYEIGRRGIEGEKIVTKARGGQSFHNYAVSEDVAFDRDLEKAGVQWSWDDGHPWQELGKLGEECGLEWGGNWQGMTGDLGHFQNSYGYSWQELKEFYDEGGMERVWQAFDKKTSN